MAVENFEAELTNILQQMRHLDNRMNILESRPSGARPEFPGAATNPVAGRVCGPGGLRGRL
eukprot:14448955-Alexandrium_andersonii.AAC.1